MKRKRYLNKGLEPLLKNLRYSKAIKYIQPDSTVLDIGCGIKFEFLKRISPIVKSAVGLDSLAIETKTENIEIRKIEVGLENIPFKNKSFDIITLLASLEHMDNIFSVSSELKRLLKKKGKLIFTTPSVFCKPFLHFLSFFRLLDKKNLEEHRNYFTKTKLRDLFSWGKIEKLKYFQLGMNILCIVKKS